MVYTHDKFPNNPAEFPAPPLFLTWIQQVSYRWDPGTRGYSIELKDNGEIRHYSDLAKAKKRITRYAKPNKWSIKHYGTLGEFNCNWAIYRWDVKKGEYVLQYEGRTGGPVQTNALFTQVIRGEKRYAERTFEREEAAAIESILTAV